jgi:hypothetical protein
MASKLSVFIVTARSAVSTVFLKYKRPVINVPNFSAFQLY